MADPAQPAEPAAAMPQQPSTPPHPDNDIIKPELGTSSCSSFVDSTASEGSIEGPAGSKGHEPSDDSAADDDAAVASTSQAAEPYAPSAEEQERIDAAEALKREGNELYGQGKYLEASESYWQAIDTATEAAPQRAVYYANLAACSLKLEQHKQAVEQCTAALKVDERYVKALMRRSAAFETLDDPEHALEDAKKVQEVDSDSDWARHTIARLQPLVTQRQETMKEEMMGKLKDLGNSLLGKFGLSLDNFKTEKDPTSGGYSIKFQQS